jgi:hypothetical protein
MTDEIWEARRQRLADQVIKASHDLLVHTGASSFYLPFGDGCCITAGPTNALPSLIESATAPVDKDC